MSRRWIAGNRIDLLENGEQYFPRVFEAIAEAKHEVVIEVFILFEDKVGLALHSALVAAAERGVQIDLTIDGYGSPDLSPQFISSLTTAGVRVHVFDPRRKLWGMRTNLFRRMHRKIVIIDAKRAFIGGMNFSADHLADFGPEAKLDHAAEVEGPIVDEMHAFVHRQLGASQTHRRWFRRRATRSTAQPARGAGSAEAMFATRDNTEHTDDIERHYRIAIRAARRRIVIANAYFFPGYRLLHQLRRAARRGVDVRLILQGQPDMPIVRIGASMLHHHLLRAGVRLFEYCERPMHSKVALTDDEWSTIGSSNLDPLSLALNLEANLVIRDRDFNAQLSERLEHLMQHSCKELKAELNEPRLWLLIRSFFVFHLLRRFPAWAGWLPAHVPKLARAHTHLPESVEPEATLSPNNVTAVGEPAAAALREGADAVSEPRAASEPERSAA